MNNQHKTIDHCFALCAAMAFFFSFVFCACSNDENIAEGGGEDDVAVSYTHLTLPTKA